MNITGEISFSTHVISITTSFLDSNSGAFTRKYNTGGEHTFSGTTFFDNPSLRIIGFDASKSWTKKLKKFLVFIFLL